MMAAMSRRAVPRHRVVEAGRRPHRTVPESAMAGGPERGMAETAAMAEAASTVATAETATVAVARQRHRAGSRRNQGGQCRRAEKCANHRAPTLQSAPSPEE